MLRILVKMWCCDFDPTSDRNRRFCAMDISEMSHRVAKDA